MLNSVSTMKGGRKMSRALEMSVNHVTKAMEKASKHYGKQFKMPKVYVKEAKGRGGYCKISGFLGLFTNAEIMISSYWFRIKGAKWLKDTCYHEVAHWITHCLHGKVSPHGAEWKRVMRVCFDMKPDRCFQVTLDDKVRQMRTRKVRTRTPAQIQADKERMARVRAAREVK